MLECVRAMKKPVEEEENSKVDRKWWKNSKPSDSKLCNSGINSKDEGKLGIYKEEELRRTGVNG